MPLRPQRRKPTKPPLQVFSSTPWGRLIYFCDSSGKKVEIKKYEEAREYAAANGYDGIRIGRVDT